MGKANMTNIKCNNCGEMGHFARKCLKPRENTNIARKNEQNREFSKLMDVGNSSVCEEWAMISTDVYCDEEYEELIVYGDQGISTKPNVEETYGVLLKTDSEEEPVVKYNVEVCAQESVSLEKKQRRLNRDIPSEAETQLSLINKENDIVQNPTRYKKENESQKAWTMGMPTIDGDISMTDSEELRRIEDKTRSSYMLERCMQII